MIQSPPSTSSAPSPKSVSLAALAVTNAILTSIATATTPSVITAFTGALGGGPFTAPRTVSVTTSSHAGSYNVGAGNAITIKGLDVNGAAATASVALVATGGGETIVTAQAFKSITEIDIPGQNDALGAFTVGVQDVVMAFRRVRVGTTGNVKYQCALDGTTDTIPSVAAAETLEIAGTKLFGDTGTTASNITLYA